MPDDRERKSWSLTLVETRSHFTPAFLRLPTSSRFLASMLMMGSPWRQKLFRSRAMRPNCWSRPERDPEEMFLRLPRSEKRSLPSNRATVRAPTWMPSRCSCPAILMVVLCVHRQLLIGSPAISLSNSLSISAITAGVFFRRLAAAAWSAYPLRVYFLCQQFFAPASHGVRIQLQQRGQLLVAPTAELQGFQARIQPALLLVEQAREENQRGLQFLRGDFGGSAARNLRERLAGQDLASPHSRICGTVQKKSGDLLTGNPLLLEQLKERIFSLDVQELLQFVGQVALGSTVDQSFDGRHQRAPTREPDGLKGPQAVGIELGDLSEGVVAAAMGVAGMIGEHIQLAKHRSIDGGPQGLFQFRQSGDFLRAQEEAQMIGEEGGGSHNAIVPPFVGA